MDSVPGYLVIFCLGILLGGLPTKLLSISIHVWSLLPKPSSILPSLDHLFLRADYLRNVEVKLLDRHQVEKLYGEETWQRQSYEAFGAQLVRKDKIFPCLFGTRGFKGNELDFVFLPSEDLGSKNVAQVAAKSILEYHKQVRSRGPNTSLVMIAPRSAVEHSVDEYHKLFWSLLHGLRKLDPKPWPRDVPRDTSAERWCFNFDNTSAFFAVQSPGHVQRESRYAPNMCIVYTPRFVIDALFPNPKNRESTTKTIRRLVDRYDTIPRSPDISSYAAPGTTESRQYFLLDENKPAVCPYESLDDDEVPGQSSYA
ncbi:MAG: hypothetical protein Q9201_000035 [Fulgogasparrea decipioides]